MPVILVTLLTWFARFLVIKALVLLGVGVFSYAIIQYMFDKYVNQGLAQIGALGSDMAMFIGISHLDHAISIVLGAMSVRAFMSAMKVAIIKL